MATSLLPDDFVLFDRIIPVIQDMHEVQEMKKFFHYFLLNICNHLKLIFNKENHY